MYRFLLLCAALTVQAEDAATLFATKIQPALKRDCAGCHGDGQVLSKLDLRTRETLLRGGSRGPAVTPGKPEDSPLLAMIESKAMPPGRPWPAEMIGAVREWIAGGAPWAENSQWSNAYKQEDLWAFRPVPARNQAKSIDAFLNEALRAKGLQPAGRADRRTLIRRVTIDLTGLPPTAEEIDAFVKDNSPAAWARLVDRLLASPRYGERWGRHWLDVVRYADTSGYSNDFERPNAWRYRDYVIRAFQNDKPYDRFIREQIAGDELFPGDAEALIATGFLRAGPWEHTGMSVEAVTRQMFLDDVTHATASTFLGLTLGCAKCHDHKFDPIPTKDYYRMQAVFATTEFARPALPFLPVENTNGLAAAKAHMQKVVDRTRAMMDATKGVSEKDAEKYEEFKLHQKHLALYKESLDRFEPKAFAVSSGPLDGVTDGGPNLRYPKRDAYQAPAVHILPGGNVQSPAEKVTPGVLSALEAFGSYAAPPVTESVAGRRAALAEWIANPKNPLTARVMVNRIWQYHFGRGIAADASNFGKMGKKPSHPELLDWLAAAFVESGWSIKAMHRLMLLSDAYQRASGKAPDADPENALLSVFAPRRVEAEVLRDAILAASGELQTEAGGPGVFPEINEDVARQPQHRMGSLAPAYRASPLRAQRHRRTIYTFQQRSLIDPMVEVFNGPSLDLSCERRDASTVPTQAFTLFNGQFVHDMALALASRVKDVDAAMQRVLGRAPNDSERRTLRASYERLLEHHTKTGPPAKPQAKPVVHTITSELTGESHRFVQQEDPEPFEANLHPSEVTPRVRALADIVVALFNSNEFVYVY